MQKHASPYGGGAVKRGMLFFLAGRGASAVLTFSAFSVAAHALELRQYGYYAACLALMELLLALSTGGIDWVASRVLPECRMHASGRTTSEFIWRLFFLQSIIYVFSACVVYFAADFLALNLRLVGAESVFRVTACLIFVEGVGRLARDQMLGILMEQRAGQVAQVSRSALFLLLLVYSNLTGGDLDAYGVLTLEIIASGLAAIVGFVLLFYSTLKLHQLPANDPLWQFPPIGELIRLAWHTYASYLLALAYGPQILTMLIARLIGPDAVAVYGFARGFADQIRRYLPTDLLQSVIRPALIAHYSHKRDFADFSVKLGLWLKTSLVVLFPILLFFAAFGKLGMQAIGGGRFSDAANIVLVLMIGAGLMSWRRIMELAANTVLASDLVLRAASTLILIPCLIFVGMQGFPVLLPSVLLAVCGEGVFCLQVFFGLARRGYKLTWDRMGYFRLLIGWLGAYVLLIIFQQITTLNLPASIFAAIIVGGGAILVVRPLCEPERLFVEQWIGRYSYLLCYQKGAAI